MEIAFLVLISREGERFPADTYQCVHEFCDPMDACGFALNVVCEKRFMHVDEVSVCVSVNVRM